MNAEVASEAGRTADLPSLRRVPVIGLPITAVDWDAAIARISQWAQRHESRYVCICNVHSCVTASSDPQFSEVVEAADMATPDGAPVAWMLRRLGAVGQQRISGPDLMLRYCEHAQGTGESIYLFGSTDETLTLLQARLVERFPGLRIAGVFSPPFRPLTAVEDHDIVERINASGAGTVWVSLGCPKQERWMAEHRDRVRAVMLGVGAAFDYHAGVLSRAPTWMQRAGLEWLYRLMMEPRRLWRRYLVTNSIFIVSAFRQLWL